MVADLSATTMLNVIVNLLPASALQDLHDFCDIYGRLKEQHDGEAHSAPDPILVLPTQCTQPLSRRRSLPQLSPATSGNSASTPADRSRVMCDTNNDLDWHINKDEMEGRRSGHFLLPLLSAVSIPS